MAFVRWSVIAALAAGAAYLSLQHATPVDRALPAIAIAMTVVAAVSYPSLMLSVPLLVLTQTIFPDEPSRLLAIGAVVAAVFAIALTALPRRRDDPRGVEQALVLTAIAVLILRWIPLESLQAGREVLLLSLCLFLVVVLDGTPLAVAVAVATALVTPAVPLRTLALPLIVLALAVGVKVAGVPRIAVTWPSCAAMAGILLFFPWSGVAARAFPYFLSERSPARPERRMLETVTPGQSLRFDVPPDAVSIVLSGANVSHLPPGTELGRIDPPGNVVRLGDASDWGYMRKEQYFASRNHLPRDPAGSLRGYGYAAWLDGAGRIRLPRGLRHVEVTASIALPRDASLQVEGFESGIR